MKFDLRRLGDWADLPFFTENLPRIESALTADKRVIFPPQDQVFAALEMTQPDDVKVVILGQDPYHTPGKADGLAFSITRDFGGRLDSLGNIFKEMQSDLALTRTRTDLGDLADQGVLLLNTILTVPQGKAKGHATLGWQELTSQVLARLADRPRAFGEPQRTRSRRMWTPNKISKLRPSTPRRYPHTVGFSAQSRSAAPMHGCRRRAVPA